MFKSQNLQKTNEIKKFSYTLFNLYKLFLSELNNLFSKLCCKTILNVTSYNLQSIKKT